MQAEVRWDLAEDVAGGVSRVVGAYAFYSPNGKTSVDLVQLISLKVEVLFHA